VALDAKVVVQQVIKTGIENPGARIQKKEVATRHSRF
jgi:hypothetical protein